MPRPVSLREFKNALWRIPRPRGKQLQFLAAHAAAKGRALNMHSIARSAKYKNYRAGNLQYGLLAERIGKELGRRHEGLGLLMEFVAPRGRSGDHISNDEWILIMRPNFANALRRVGWIK